MSDTNTQNTAQEEAAERDSVMNGESGPGAAADFKADEPQDPIEALTRERDALKDQLLRVLAETENFKKRAQRDQAEFMKRANEGLLRDLLPVLDNLERALNAAQESEEACGVVQGLEMIQGEFIKVLEKNGLEEIPAMGQPFDPEVHEAMMQQEAAEADENTVLCVYQKGYRHKDRLLRPAMVVVSKRPAGYCGEDGGTAADDEKGKKINIKVN